MTFDIEQDDYSDYPEYLDTVPLISQEMEFELDRVISFLAKKFGFASTKEFAGSIINDTLDATRLNIYNDMIGHVIEKHRKVA